MALDQYGLTPRQRAFADYYIETGNATEAARRAGYKAKNADVIASQNLGKLAIKQYIAEHMQRAEEKRIASADEVLQFLTDVMAGKVKDQFGLDASLQDRIKASQELMKRYAVADMRQQSTMQRLDSLFVEFRAALSAAPEPQPTSTEATEGSTQGTATEAGSATDTAPEPA
jgi:phage terminase small subunit